MKTRDPSVVKNLTPEQYTAYILGRAIALRNNAIQEARSTDKSELRKSHVKRAREHNLVVVWCARAFSIGNKTHQKRVVK